jgi:hypothetical protein
MPAAPLWRFHAQKSEILRLRRVQTAKPHEFGQYFTEK